MLAILLAYFLVSFKFIEARSLPYEILNLTGAAGIVVEAGSKKDKQPMVLNIVWALIALIVIVQIIFH